MTSKVAPWLPQIAVARTPTKDGASVLQWRGRCAWEATMGYAVDDSAGSVRPNRITSTRQRHRKEPGETTGKLQDTPLYVQFVGSNKFIFSVRSPLPDRNICPSLGPSTPAPRCVIF